MSNDKKMPLGETRGKDAGNDERAMASCTLPLALDFTTGCKKEQKLSVGEALRVRDAMITAERRLLEVRTAFEADIANILKMGGKQAGVGHD